MRFTDTAVPEETIVQLEHIVMEGRDGVELKASGEYRYRAVPGSVGVNIGVTLRNASSVEISEIFLEADVKDPDGTVLEVIETVWKGYDIPLAVGEEAGSRMYRSYQSETVPPELSVTVRITKVRDVQELPPVHRPQPGEYLYLALSNEHMAKMKENPPTAVKLGIDRMGNRRIAEVTMENGLPELIEAFTKIRIRNDHGACVTDNYNFIHFTFGDGEEFGINLLLRNMTLPMRKGRVCYEFEDFEPFWALMCAHCGVYDHTREIKWAPGFGRGRF